MPIIILCQGCNRTFEMPQGYEYYSGMVNCVMCGRTLFVSIDQGNIRQVALTPRTTIDIEGAPPKIRSGFREAQLCLNTQAYNASVVMLRRVLELLCADKKAEGRVLSEKLDYLKMQGTLSSDLADAAKEIRYFGNYGAHPSEDLIGEVQEADAIQVFEVALHVIRAVYEVPPTVEALRRRRTPH